MRLRIYEVGDADELIRPVYGNEVRTNLPDDRDWHSPVLAAVEQSVRMATRDIMEVVYDDDEGYAYRSPSVGPPRVARDPDSSS